MSRYHSTLNMLLLISVSEYINNRSQVGCGEMVHVEARSE